MVYRTRLGGWRARLRSVDDAGERVGAYTPGGQQVLNSFGIRGQRGGGCCRSTGEAGSGGRLADAIDLDEGIAGAARGQGQMVDELTPKMSLKRRPIAQKYAATIDSLYADVEEKRPMTTTSVASPNQMIDDGGWHRIDRGTGRPLVLLHGGGASAGTWLPVLDQLAAHRRVIAFDIPGFGKSPVPPDVEFTMEWALDHLAAELSRLGIVEPVDLVGNSMGGLIALDAAKRGLARSVVGIAPAGLWRHHMPLVLRSQFTIMIAGAGLLRHPEVMTVLRKLPGARKLLLGMAIARPEAVEWDEIMDIIRYLHISRPTLESALRYARRGYAFTGGRNLDLPITVAFGTKDHLLRPRGYRLPDELPSHTRWISLPGCGHVPMWDNPDLIARTILEGTDIRTEAIA